MDTPPKTVDAHIADFALLQTKAHGAGVLWVAPGAQPEYRPMDRVEPPAFREMVQKTWDQEHHDHALVVLHQDRQLHVVKVPKALDAEHHQDAT